MQIGTSVAATPDFLRWIAQDPFPPPIQLNQEGVVAHIVHLGTMVEFTPNVRYLLPHWMAQQMARHEVNLWQCARLIHGYNQLGGWG